MILEEIQLIQDDLTGFSPESKVWVYYSTSNFNSNRPELNIKIQDFVKSWKSHGDEVIGKGYIISDQIILLIADISKSGVSGCSTDSSVRFIQSLATIYNLDLMNRNYVYTINNNSTIERTPLVEIQSLDANTPIFNPFFQDLNDWKMNFIQPINDSKYKRLL